MYALHVASVFSHKLVNYSFLLLAVFPVTIIACEFLNTIWVPLVCYVENGHVRSNMQS